MWATWVVAAIALAAATFMVRFLIVLLREGAPLVCYWVVPVRGRPGKGCHLSVLRGIYVGEDCRAPEHKPGDYYAESLENENYAKEEGSSGLIALDARAISNSLGWRSIHPGRGNVFRENRL
jgi:hypothetical protein